jgi:hypothetical protein
LGYTAKGKRKKRKRRSVGEEASIVVLLLLPQAGPSGPVVEDGGGPSRRYAIVVAGNDGLTSAQPSDLILPQRAAWLAAPSMAPLSGAVPSVDDAVLVRQAM